MMKRCALTIGLLALLVALSHAFVVPTTTTVSTLSPSRPTTQPVTQLSERRWNFNDGGRSPWGLKKNAEIWNGRVAQVAFVVIFLQELIQGKGVIQGIQDGDFINIFFMGLTALATVGLTAWLAIKGSDDLPDVEL